MLKTAFFAIIAATIGGCMTMPVTPYSVSVGNIYKIKTKSENLGLSVKVNEFRAAPNITPEIACRGVGPVVPSPGKSFEKYVRDAILDEFILAGIYKDDGKITLDGRLDYIDFTSVGEPAWDIKISLRSSNGRDLSISEHFLFEAGYIADVACRNVANALAPAVQSLLNKMISHPDFVALVSSESKP